MLSEENRPANFHGPVSRLLRGALESVRVAVLVAALSLGLVAGTPAAFAQVPTFPMTFNATALTLDAWILSGPTALPQLPNTVQVLNLQAGFYTLIVGSGNPMNCVLEVTSMGRWNYATSCDGFIPSVAGIQGRGTNNLVITGYTVFVDATRLTTSEFIQTNLLLDNENNGFDSSVVHQFQMVPAPLYGLLMQAGFLCCFYEVGLDGRARFPDTFPGGAPTGFGSFTRTDTTPCPFESALPCSPVDNTVTILGKTIQIDATALGSGEFHLFSLLVPSPSPFEQSEVETVTIPPMPLDCPTCFVTFFSSFSFGTSQILSFSWKLLNNGLIDFDPALDSVVSGRGTTRMTVFGNAGDRDRDGIPNAIDNCPDTRNPDQLDSDGDGIGNACDRCAVQNTLEENVDEDGDGIGDGCTITWEHDAAADYNSQVTTDGDPTPPAAGSSRIVTATFNYIGIDRDGDGLPDPITVFWKGCFSFHFTVVRQSDSTVLEPIFRHTTALAIPDDLITVQPGESRSVQCDLGEWYDPTILSAGSYDVLITFASRAQDPDLSPTGVCSNPPCQAIDIIQVTSPPAALTIGSPPPAGTPPITKVEIDIEPGLQKNVWPCRLDFLIPVAVLGSADFDASKIDPKQVRFGKTGTEALDPTRNLVPGAKRMVDVNRDGFNDMLFGFRFKDTGFSCVDIPAGERSIDVSPILTGPAQIPVRNDDGTPKPGQFTTIQITDSDTLRLKRFGN